MVPPGADGPDGAEVGLVQVGLDLGLGHLDDAASRHLAILRSDTRVVCYERAMGTPDSGEYIRYEVVDRVARITVDRPEDVATARRLVWPAIRNDLPARRAGSVVELCGVHPAVGQV